jgi:hypothetical protein
VVSEITVLPVFDPTFFLSFLSATLITLIFQSLPAASFYTLPAPPLLFFP